MPADARPRLERAARERSRAPRAAAVAQCPCAAAVPPHQPAHRHERALLLRTPSTPVPPAIMQASPACERGALRSVISAAAKPIGPPLPPIASSLQTVRAPVATRGVSATRGHRGPAGSAREPRSRPIRSPLAPRTAALGTQRPNPAAAPPPTPPLAAARAAPRRTAAGRRRRRRGPPRRRRARRRDDHADAQGLQLPVKLERRSTRSTPRRFQGKQARGGRDGQGKPRPAANSRHAVS
jgi:hypothetical protein